MKAVRWIAVIVLAYVGIVALFESMLGYFQPSGARTLVITTTGADGDASDRVVARLETDAKLYVAANHWPRAWYRAVLARPDVQVTLDGTRADYRAVPVSGEERERVESEHPLRLVFRLLTGFPPRHFVRLDPR